MGSNSGRRAEIAREFDYVNKTVQTKLRSMGARPRRPSSKRLTKRGRKLLELWRFMREKCSATTHPSYEHHGGQGIRVCSAWDESFDAFYDWAVSMGYKSGLRLARKNRSRGYSPTHRGTASGVSARSASACALASFSASFRYSASTRSSGTVWDSP